MPQRSKRGVNVLDVERRQRVGFFGEDLIDISLMKD